MAITCRLQNQGAYVFTPPGVWNDAIQLTTGTIKRQYNARQANNGSYLFDLCAIYLFRSVTKLAIKTLFALELCLDSYFFSVSGKWWYRTGRLLRKQVRIMYFFPYSLAQVTWGAVGPLNLPCGTPLSSDPPAFSRSHAKCQFITQFAVWGTPLAKNKYSDGDLLIVPKPAVFDAPAQNYSGIIVAIIVRNTFRVWIWSDFVWMKARDPQKACSVSFKVESLQT